MITVLHIGIKEWPYSSAHLEGKNRGGGVGKYAEMLINGYPDRVKTILITRKLHNQLAEEKNGNVYIYRVKALPGRKLRIISLGIKSFFKALFIVKKQNVSIIQTHIFFNNLLGLLLKKITHLPVIAVPHSALYHKYTPEMNDLRRRVERLTEKWIYKNLDKIVLFSEDHLKKYIGYTGLNPGNFQVISTGIKIPPISRPEFVRSNIIKLLFVGRLEKRKAIDHVIEALNYLDKKSLNHFILDIVGEGSELESLKCLVEKYQLEQYVFFHGYVSNPAEFYKNADVFMLVTHTEGLSMALLEAMASWNMCIVNDFGVPFSNKSVMILKNNDPKTIHKALLDIVMHPEIIEEYATRANQEILNSFTVDVFVSNYVKLYEHLIYEFYKTKQSIH